MRDNGNIYVMVVMRLPNQDTSVQDDWFNIYGCALSEISMKSALRCPPDRAAEGEGSDRGASCESLRSTDGSHLFFDVRNWTRRTGNCWDCCRDNN